MSTEEVPKLMKALYLTKYVTDNNSDTLEDHFEVKQVPVPEPKSGEVLVKIACSPINPSDLSTLSGTYNAAQREELPCQLGYEASGTVVKNGGGMVGWYYMGKRVGCCVKTGGRTWAEYAVIPAFQLIALPDDVTFEEGSSCFVNPLTAIAFVETAQAMGAKAILHTAASSALGKMLVKYTASLGMQVVAVVRRQEQVDSLKEIGCEHVINSSNNDWEATLKTVCKETNCFVGFDAVAGELTGKVLKAMPRGSTLHVYGGLSNQHCAAVRPTDLIFENKTLTGFWLTKYLRNKNLYQMKSMVDTVAGNLKQSLGTEIRVSYPLDKAGPAVRDYSKNMSAGKVGFAPSN